MCRASIAAAYKLAVFVIEMRRYTHVNPVWARYEMSRLVPPQFDTYGTSFWIPSQVEPTVALIGTSLPAIRQSIGTITERFFKVWTSISRSIFTSKRDGTKAISKDSAGSYNLVDASPKVTSHRAYHEIDDVDKAPMGRSV